MLRVCTRMRVSPRAFYRRYSTKPTYRQPFSLDDSLHDISGTYGFEVFRLSTPSMKIDSALADSGLFQDRKKKVLSGAIIFSFLLLSFD